MMRTAEDFAPLLDGGLDEDALAERLRALADAPVDGQAIAALALALRRRMRRVVAPPGAIDVCGTGGDHSNSLNVSTAVAIVVAACGVPVAKHGNRAATSRAGAADTLAALGILGAGDVATAERQLLDLSITFLFAPDHHPALAPLAPVRRALGRRTVFNLVGPLANPAGVTRQLIGVASPELLDPYADAVVRLGTQRTLLVSGEEGLDEISVSGRTHGRLIEGDRVIPVEVTPTELSMATHPVDALLGGDAAHNAAALAALLDGRPGAYADAVMVNAAAALWVANRAPSIAAGRRLAGEAIGSGKARDLLTRWRRESAA